MVRQLVSLTPSDIAAKSITLDNVPINPSGVEVFPWGGIPQRYNVDYVVSSNVLSWGGLGLDGFLEPNDELEIVYLTT